MLISVKLMPLWVQELGNTVCAEGNSGGLCAAVAQLNIQGINSICWLACAGTGPGCMASLTFHSLKKPSRCNKDNRRDGCFGKLRGGKKKIYLQPVAALHFLVRISSHCAQKLLSVWSLLTSPYQNDLQMAKQTANLP